MMDNNYQYSKELLHYCLERGNPVPVRFVPQPPTADATSDFIESREYENR